ncbi:interleukin-1 receptor-like 1 [Sceloporus undulatus]|uniref:interleukin-1 receptor-like 1 n=1 Tax=Sceloporus undulatus TaxID=8520 RepID=UPI001C4D03AB|nr:interleukin-1 receptor-like 1 [Sceloporus undulatus]
MTFFFTGVFESIHSLPGYTIEGEAFVVECALSSVTCHHDDKDISTDKEARIHSSDNQLWFLPALREDSGNYTCVDSEDASTEIISVTVYPRKEGICYYENALYQENVGSPGSGIIYCPSFDNYENISNLKWYKRYTSFEKLLWRPLKVLYPKDNEVIEVKIGSSQNLSCKALVGEGADTQATSFWECTGEKDPERFVRFHRTYMESYKKQVTEAILQISKVREEDLGLNFTCFMANDMGYKRVSVTLRKAPSTDGKIYDAYVIYPTNHVNGIFENNFVSSFVHQILPEVLENKCGYKLCIYGRDVLPGEDAINAIERRIQKSRRLIILLTECLAKSECFMYEHQIAFYNALIQNDVKVILLEMERIGEYAQLQESLRHLIHQRGTIKWKANYMAHPTSTSFAFWKHVEYQMPPRRKPTTMSSAYINL